MRQTVRYMINALLPAWIALSALPIAAMAAGNAGGQTVCDGRYALCSHAQCSPGANAKQVVCHCIVPPAGLNLGNSPCRERKAAKTPQSQFSLYDLEQLPHKPAMKAFRCSGQSSARWAFCLDGSCHPAQGAAGKAGQVDCTCGLKARSRADFYVFTNSCRHDPKTFCANTWSAATFDELNGGYEALNRHTKNPPDLVLCPN